MLGFSLKIPCLAVREALHNLMQPSFLAASSRGSALELQLRGKGTPAIGHSGTNCQDYEGIFRRAPQTEALNGIPPWVGARKVAQLLESAEDFSDAVWGKVNVNVTTGQTDPNGGSDAATITATAASGTIRQLNTIAAGSDGISSIWIKRNTGSGNIQLWDGSGYDTIPVTTSWQRFAVSGVYGAGGPGFYLLIAVDADAVDIAFAQQENATGRTDTTTPSEYQSSSDPVTGDLFDANAYLTGTGNWSPYGTNTVTTIDGENGVVLTYVDNTTGAVLFLKDAFELTTDLVVGATYQVTFDAKVDIGAVTYRVSYVTSVDDIVVTSTSWKSITVEFTAGGATGCHILMHSLATGEIAYIKDIVLKQVTNTAYHNTENALSVRSNVVDETGEYVTEGDFETDSGAWTKGTGWTISGGTASSDGSQASVSSLSQDTLQQVGVPVEITYTISGYSAGSIRPFLGNGAPGPVVSANGTHTFAGVVAGNTTLIMQADANFVGSIDNVSVKRINSGGQIDKELITNGGTWDGSAWSFSNTDGWTANDAAAQISVVDGALRVQNGDASSASGSESFTTIAGRKYVVNYGFILGTATSGRVRIGSTGAGSNDYYSKDNFASGDLQASFIATTTTTTVTLINNTATINLYSDFEYITIHQETPYLQYADAATNLITDSRDLTGWTESGTPVDTYDQVGITGEANTATYLEDDDGAVHEGVNKTVSITSDVTSSARVWIKKDTDETRFPVFQLQLSGGTGVYAHFWLNTKTGGTDFSGTALEANTSRSVHQEGDWWVYTVSITDVGTNTNLLTIAYPALGAVIGTAAATTGSIIVGQVEAYDNTTLEEVQYRPPIYTSGGAASDTRTVYNFDLANHSDTQGLWFMEWIPGADRDMDAGSLRNIFSTNTATTRLITWVSSASIRSHDGTNQAIIATPDFDSGEQVNIALAYGGAVQNIGADGTYSSDATYRGDYDTSVALEIGVFSVMPFGFRNLQFWPLPYDAAKVKGLELMQ